jgi:hypothetical protein
MTARYRRTSMTSNPIPIGRLAFAMLTRIDLSEIGGAMVVAGVVAAVVTALSIESEYLDLAPNAVAAQAAAASVPAVHHAPTWAGIVAAVVTASSIETESLDPAPNAVAAQAATASVPAVHREPTWTDAPLRGLSPSEVWAADESAHGMRPEAAH